MDIEVSKVVAVAEDAYIVAAAGAKAGKGGKT